MKRREDIVIGATIGRLTLLREVERRSYTERYECQCSCGTIKVISRNNIINGSRSCGCLQKESSAALATHRQSYSPEYTTWKGMKQRCLNENSPVFRHYGARGISVCAEWRNSFEKFLSDVGKRPTPKHTLERLDNNGNYDPANCKWATRREQSLNRRVTVKLTHNGITKTLREWEAETGVHWHNIYCRMRQGHDSATCIKPGRLPYGPRARWKI